MFLPEFCRRYVKGRADVNPRRLVIRLGNPLAFVLSSQLTS
jgi:hypothetical protein